MGYKIGVPSMKLNNSGNKSKHCGSFGGVSREGLEEREGLDKDINHELSHLNIYNGIRSAAELMEYSQKHLEELRDASGRKIRSDAVVMCTTIFKPPAAYMKKLSYEEQCRLLNDCGEFFENIVGKNNIKATADHFDELGPHRHIFWEPMTSDGRLCAKEIHNLKFFAKINEGLPAFLRECGWDIEDADCYDKAQRDEEELEKQEEERYQKRMKQGRSSAAYKLEAEETKQRLEQENDKLFAQKLATEKEVKELKEKIGYLDARVVATEAKLNVLSPIKTQEEYEAAVASVPAELQQIENALDKFDEELTDADELAEQGAYKTAYDTIVYAVDRIFPKIREWLDLLKEKIANIKAFEIVNDIKDKASEAFDRTLEALLSRAKVDSDRANTARAGKTYPSRDDYDDLV